MLHCAKLGGTLGGPRLSLDQKGVVLAGGPVVATGGLSVLAKVARDRLDRLSRQEGACEEATKQAPTALHGYLE